MGRSESSQTEQRETDWDVVPLGEGADFLHCAREDNAVPRQDYGPLRAMDQFKRLFILLPCGRQVGPVSWQLRLDRFPVELACGLLRILSDIHEHRARPPGTCHIKCFADRARDLIRMRDQIIVFGDRQRDTRYVSLLKRVRSDKFAANLPSDAD